MELTNKCKEDFFKYWDISEEKFTESFSDREIVSMIIDWFDKIGIYILPYRENEFFYCEIQFSKKMAEKSGKNWILTTTRVSRIESISNSIKEVNEIYNEK